VRRDRLRSARPPPLGATASARRGSPPLGAARLRSARLASARRDRLRPARPPPPGATASARRGSPPLGAARLRSPPAPPAPRGQGSEGRSLRRFVANRVSSVAICRLARRGGRKNSSYRGYFCVHPEGASGRCCGRRADRAEGAAGWRSERAAASPTGLVPLVALAARSSGGRRRPGSFPSLPWPRGAAGAGGDRARSPRCPGCPERQGAAESAAAPGAPRLTRTARR